MQLDVLITGCSGGIGAALARDLHRRGNCVFATARRPETLAPLAELGIETRAPASPPVGRGPIVLARDQYPPLPALICCANSALSAS